MSKNSDKQSLGTSLMMNKVKRPPSVWIAQTIIITVAVVFLVPAPWVLLDSGPNRFATRPIAFPFVVAIYTVVALVLLISFWGLMLRRPYGRWMAVGIMTILFAVLVLIFISMVFYSPAPTRPPILVLIEVGLFVALILLLILRLAIGKRVTQFFDRRHVPASFREPPPPPSFDT
jgi:hypothetical protein